MALSKKDKLLQAAQKNIQKGQWLKAAKDFQKVVELEPKDVRSRQRLAELLNRAGLAKESLEAYEAVARHYGDNGFYLKAIAVYKQMQKIDPSQEKFYRRLGHLNEKQGLVGNALGEYRQLADLYEKAGNVSELHEILEKMKELDPDNSGLRLRLCRNYLKNGLSEKAHAELQDSLSLLNKLKDPEATHKFKDLVQFYLADDIESKIEIGRIMLLCRQAEPARVMLVEEAEKHPERRDILPVLAKAYRQIGDFGSEQRLYGDLLTDEPDQIDYQEGFARACLDCGDARQALERLESWKDNFLRLQRAAVLKEFYEELQVLCEGDERVRQTLHLIYENTGEGGKLFDLLSSEGTQADNPRADATDALETTCEWFGDDLLETEPKGSDASGAGSAPAGETAAEPSPADTSGGMSLEHSLPLDDGEELELEIELDLDDLDMSQDAASLEEIPEADLCEDAEAPAGDFDLQGDLDVGGLDFGQAGSAGRSEDDILPENRPGADVAAKSPETGGETAGLDDCLADLQQELGEVFDMDDFDLGDDEPDPTSDLEEAEFYLQQGFLEEARRKCQSLLDRHPQCEEGRDLLRKVEESLARSAPAAPQSPPAGNAAEPAAEPVKQAAVSRDQSRLEGNLNAFKKGIEDAVAQDDCETHFNLGIAYKEMGLLDEAIDEFNKAKEHPSRFFDALTLTGLCLADKGAFEQAAELFKQGLQRSGLMEGDRLNLYFELGQLYVAWGRPLEALDSFQQVADADISYRDVGDLIRALRKKLGLDDGGDAGGPAGGSDSNRVSYL